MAAAPSCQAVCCSPEYIACDSFWMLQLRAELQRFLWTLAELGLSSCHGAISDGPDTNKQIAQENFQEEKSLGSVLQICPKTHPDEQRCVPDVPSPEALAPAVSLNAPCTALLQLCRCRDPPGTTQHPAGGETCKVL